MKRLILLAAASLSALSGAARAADHTVEISGMRFQPRALSVAAGDTVTFVNRDGAPHTASGAGFDTGRLARGASATIRVASAGRYAYRCALHPAMTGELLAR